MTGPRTQGLRGHARLSLLAGAAALVLGFTPVAQARESSQQQSIEEQIDLLKLDYELSRMKALLWNATAAVAFYFADGDFEARADYKTAAARFQNHLVLAAGRVPANLRGKLADLERNWKAHRALASELLAASAKKGNGDDHRIIIAELWSKAKAIDAAINGLHAIVINDEDGSKAPAGR